eukprot:4434295-Amphidinium_carterae.1
MFEGGRVRLVQLAKGRAGGSLNARQQAVTRRRFHTSLHLLFWDLKGFLISMSFVGTIVAACRPSAASILNMGRRSSRACSKLQYSAYILYMLMKPMRRQCIFPI